MLKYYNAMVVFEEIPDEITLAINITNCPCKCPGCHSKFLWGDIGSELSFSEIERLVERNKGITCVCLMGGDANPSEINELAKFIKNNLGLKCGWYSGMDVMSGFINKNNFSYIKIGHYSEEFGPLNKETTNQRLYKIQNGEFVDITNKFWKKR